MNGANATPRRLLVLGLAFLAYHLAGLLLDRYQGPGWIALGIDLFAAGAVVGTYVAWSDRRRHPRTWRHSSWLLLGVAAAFPALAWLGIGLDERLHPPGWLSLLLVVFATGLAVGALFDLTLAPRRATPLLLIGVGGLLAALLGWGTVDLKLLFGTTVAPGVNISQLFLLAAALCGSAAVLYALLGLGFSLGTAWSHRAQ